MNYGAGAVILVGGVLLVIGIKGTQSPVWQSLTGKPITPAGGKFNYVPPGQTVSGTGTTLPVHPIGGTTGSQKAHYSDLAYNDAVLNQIDPLDFVAQIKLESGFDPNAKSPAGAEGIAQFMPATAASLGVNPWNPVDALSAAAKLMANYVRNYGAEDKALAAYNAGEGTLQNALSHGASWFNYLPSETQNYIVTITGRQ